MKKIIIILLVLLPTLSGADDLTFQWDYGPATIDGFNLYYGKFVQQSDGSWLTQYETVPLISKINPENRQIMVEVLGLPNVIQKYCFVMRAQRGGEESEDSNEICVKINNLPIDTPSNFIGTYDRGKNILSFQWSQDEVDRINYWCVFYRIETLNYDEVGKVENIGQEQLTLNVPFVAVSEGESKTVNFVVVAYKDRQTYSQNSDEIPIFIDRSDSGVIPMVENFRFKLEIEVE